MKTLATLLLLLFYPWVNSPDLKFSERSRQGKDEISEKWVRDNYRSALDEVFHKDCPSSTFHQSTKVQWMVCIRILPPFEAELEYEFSLEKYYDGHVDGYIILPREASLLTQLRAQHILHPSARAQDLAKYLLVERRTSEKVDPKTLRELAQGLERIRLSPILPDRIIADSTRYEVTSMSFWGMRLELVLYGQGLKATHNEGPVEDWIASVVKSLLGEK